MKLAPYPSYRPSGVEWLGEVPEHWEVKRLRHALARNDGGVWGDEDNPEGTVILRSTEQTLDGGWRIEDPARRSLSQSEKDNCVLEPGDLVVTKSSGSALHIGKTSLVDREVAALSPCFSNFMQRLRFMPSVDPRIGFYMLNSPTGRQQLVFNSNTTTGLANLTGGVLGNVLFGCPPSLTEQRAIADFLDCETAKIDTLVARKRTLIERLKEKRAALISRTVTRGLPPDAATQAGLDPHPNLKPSSIDWLGKVPRHWKLERLRRACIRVTDGAHISPDISSPDFPFVSTVDLVGGRIDLTDCLWTSTESHEYLVRTGCRPQRDDVLFSKDGTIGRTAVVTTDSDFVVASSLVILSPKSTRLVAPFLNYWLNNSLLQQHLLLQLAGAALRRISVEKVGRLPVALPPIDEQRSIANFLDRETAKIDQMSAKVESAIERLQEYRTALITAAVTGKVDVRGATA